MALDDRPPPDQTTAPHASPVPRFRFSTDWLPERDRVPFFREELGKLLSLEMIPLDDRPPRHAMHFLVAGPIRLGRYQASATRYVCNRRHIQDSGSDDIIGGIFIRGSETFTYRGGTVTAAARDGWLVDTRLERDALLPEDGDLITLTIDRRALGALVRDPDRVSVDVLAQSRPGFALLRAYLEACLASPDALSPALAATFGRHVVDLVAAVLGATRDGAAEAEARGVKAARRREVLSGIAARASDPLFAVEAIAGQLAVTPRYIHRLLEETGKSFSQHLTEQRLRRAWKLLTDPTARDLKIAALAYECGFSDLSHFSRAFRRRFGETPTAVRGAAATAPPSTTPPVSPLAAALATD